MQSTCGTSPRTRAAWRSVAAKEGGADQLYHRFCHHLDTDSIYQLNSVLSILPESAHVSPACEFKMGSPCLLLLEIHLEDGLLLLSCITASAILCKPTAATS